MTEIIRYLDSANKILHRQQIKNIFLEATSLTLDSEEEKENSFKKWTDYYIDQHPEWIYLAIKGGHCVGYLMACPDSLGATNLFENFHSYKTFEDQFSQFPAHLHINTHKSLRGQGIGRLLIESVCNELQIKNREGLHIVTTPDAENIKFYEKLGFSYQLQRNFKDFKLLFMGRKLASA